MHFVFIKTNHPFFLLNLCVYLAFLANLLKKSLWDLNRHPAKLSREKQKKRFKRESGYNMMYQA